MGCGADCWGKGLKGICQGGAEAVMLSTCSCRRHHTAGLVLAWCRQESCGGLGVHCFGLQSLCLPWFGDVKCKT